MNAQAFTTGQVWGFFALGVLGGLVLANLVYVWLMPAPHLPDDKAPR